MVVWNSSLLVTLRNIANRSRSRLSIFRKRKVAGNHSRNLGILAEKDEYVAFLDDDDY